MKAPSRKTITAVLFFGFFALFFGALFWYFGGSLFTNTDNDTDVVEDRGFTFFPFGRGGTASTNVSGGNTTGGTTGNTNTGENGDINTNGEEPEIQIDRLRLIAEVPTAGGYVYRRTVVSDSLFNVAPQTEQAMRFVEVETGHIYETTDSTLNNTRITNTTIPRVHEADFIDGNSVVMRYIDPTSTNVKTFSASISQEDTDEEIEEVQTFQKLQGVFLPENIQDISINANKEILYTQTSDAGIVAIVTDAFGQNKKQIFSSPLKQWKPDWTNRTETITMTQYPSSVAYTVSQVLNRTTERTSPFVSGVQGLDVLMSPDGTRALVSYKTGQTISLYLRTEQGSYVDTGLDTYAEKCVWSSDSVLAYCAEPVGRISADAPDVWYQGLESYSDDVWRINTDDVITRVLFSPFEEGQYSLDIIDLGLSADEQYLSFRDKENQYFWTYQLEL